MEKFYNIKSIIPRYRVLRLCSVLLYLFAITAIAAAAPAENSMRRIGIFVGSNNGGKDRVMLRYAASDARAVSKVFSDMGGITAEDNILLIEPSIREINTRIDAMRDQIIRSRGINKRTEIVFYYSGHSDEDGLLLNRERYSYQELRNRINGIPSDMRIVILDSCASGAFTRLKGGVKTQPFLFDSSFSAEGYAFLTSSSANEASQESDRIAASYFTHTLVTGLRGAADSVGDGRVTLNELYRFAYSETLAMTETSMYGAQHPSYDIQVSGTGDLVLTDVKETSAGLVFDSQITGRLSIRDSSDHLVAEITKTMDRPLELGLAPGMYRITLLADGTLSRCEFVLNDGMRTLISPADFTVLAASPSQRRGTEEHEKDPEETSEKTTEEKEPESSPTVTFFSFFVNVVDENFRFPLVGFINIARGNHDIFHAGFLNWNSGNFNGLQASFINTTGGYFNGAQMGFINTAAKGTSGMQAGFINTTTALDGFQASFINTATKEVSGTQIGFINTAAQGITGPQIGFINTTTALNGFQAGFINTAAQEVSGAQIGFINTAAKGIKGPQIGFINTAGKEAYGAQLGFINTAAKGIKGPQIGFINYADSMESGIPIGFISIVRQGGYHALEYSFSEFFPVTLGLKLGVEKFYTTISTSYNPSPENKYPEEHFAAGFGIGSIIPINKYFFINPELSHFNFIRSWRTNHPSAITGEERNGYSYSLSSAVPYFGFKPGKYFSISLGPSFIWAYTYNSRAFKDSYKPMFNIYSKEFDRYSFIIGAQASVRFLF